MFQCFTKVLCSMFCIGSKFYVFRFLCFAKGLCSMLCIKPMRSTQNSSPISMQIQQPLPAFAIGSAYLDLEIPKIQGSYFGMGMEGV